MVDNDTTRDQAALPWREMVRSSLSIAAGYFTFLAATIILLYMLSLLNSVCIQSSQLETLIQLLVYIPAAYLAGYVTAAIARSNESRHALILTAALVLVSIIAHLMSAEAPFAATSLWHLIALLVILILLVPRGAAYRRRQRLKKEAGQKTQPLDKPQ